MKRRPPSQRQLVGVHGLRPHSSEAQCTICWWAMRKAGMAVAEAPQRAPLRTGGGPA